MRVLHWVEVGVFVAGLAALLIWLLVNIRSMWTGKD